MYEYFKSSRCSSMGALDKQHRCFFFFFFFCPPSSSTLPPFHPSLSPQDEVRSEPYFSPGHKTHFPQITLPIFPNSIFLFVVGYLFLYARGIDGCAAPSPSMYKCVRFTRVHIAMFVPEKEMMYAELNGVFHRSQSVSGTLVFPAATCCQVPRS